MDEIDYVKRAMENLQLIRKLKGLGAVVEGDSKLDELYVKQTKRACNFILMFGSEYYEEMIRLKV